jgi:hypothetical protein
MMTLLALPTSPLETCWAISSPPMATSPRWILKTTLNTCTNHGIPNNLLNPCSSRFKIVPIFMRQEASLLDTHRKSTLDMQKYLQLGTLCSCRRWNEKLLADKTWAQFKSHFSTAHRQHKQVQMQGESVSTDGYHSANAAVRQTEDQMAEATIGALANLATATAADRGVVATLTDANARLVKQLEDNSNELRELKALIKKERFEKRGQHSLNSSPNNYCWTHGYTVANTHTSLSCNFPKQGHKSDITRMDNMGGSQASNE